MGESTVAAGTRSPSPPVAPSAPDIAPKLEPKLAPGAASGGFEVLRRRRIYILPTAQGVCFGAMLVVMLLGSANYNNGLGYALTFLLASLALVSLVHTYRNLAGLGLRLTGGGPVFADQRARFNLVVDNRGLSERPAVVVRCRPLRVAPVGESGPAPGLWARVTRWLRARRKSAGGRAGRQLDAPAMAGDVIMQTNFEADALQRLAVLVPAQRRGWLELERVVLASRYPFGLFRAWSVIRTPARCLIYPKPAGSRPLPPESGDGREVSGRQKAGEDEFSNLRQYRAGDSLRRVDWKALARNRGLLVKEFSGSAAGMLVLRWRDTVGPTEVRIAQLTRWVCDADAAGRSFVLDLDAQRIEPRDGGAQDLGRVDRALAALALHRLPGSPGPARAGQHAWRGGV